MAFPTETVYGLGANALDSQAVLSIFKAKSRPADNPLIVHVSSREDAERVASGWRNRERLLVTKYWPGPLTLVMSRRNIVPDAVTFGMDTVAVRMPNHPVALALIRQSGVPLVAPSANSSGKPSPTSAEHVLSDLQGKIDVVLDAGPTEIGVESTVVDVTAERPVILRPGAISVEELEREVGATLAPPHAELARRSPGMRYRHYAPAASVEIVKEGDVETLSRSVLKHLSEGRRVIAVVHSEEFRAADIPIPRIVLENDNRAIARDLYSTLRDCDSRNADVILFEEVREEGIGYAVMERIRRATRR